MLTFSALIAGVFTMIMPFASIPNLNEERIHLVRVVMGSFWGFVALIGVWWIVLMTRPRIIALFKNQQSEVPTESQRPLSITIIGGLFLFFAIIGFPFQFVVHTPFIFFGQIIQGTVGLLMNLVLATVYLVLGIGLLRLDRRAYLGTLGFLGYGALNAFVMTLLPNRAEKFQAMLAATPGFNPSELNATGWMLSPWYTIVVSILFLGFPAYCLITRRAAFYKVPQVETQETLVV